jgi:hypothetical protein
MPIFSAPFRCFDPTDVAAGGTILTSAIPCFGARQVTILVRAANVSAFTALTSSSSTAYLPVADTSRLAVGATAICTAATNIAANQYITSVTPETRGSTAFVAGVMDATLASSSGLVVGQGVSLAGYIPPDTVITSVSASGFVMSKPALASGTGATLAARVTLSASASATSAVPFPVTVAGAPTVAAIGIIGSLSTAFSADSVTWDTAANLIGTTPVSNYAAAVTLPINTAGGGQYFSFCLGSPLVATAQLAALPVPWCHFSMTAGPATYSLRGVTVDAFVYGENFSGCY